MVTTLSTGLRTGDDARSVGKAAAADAYAELDMERVDFCQVFCTSALDPSAALAGVRSTIGADAALVGCASTGEFTESHTADTGVAVGLVAGDDVEFHVGLGTDLTADPARAVREALSDVPAPALPHRTAITLHDGLGGASVELGRALKRELGPRVLFAGGAASDNYAFASTPVFCGDRVVEDAVVVATIDTEKRSTVIANHGHEPITEPLEVTAADGRLVTEIDDRPALEVWRDAVRDSVREAYDLNVDDVGVDDPEFDRLLAAHEFALDHGQNYTVRWFQVEDAAAGSLEFVVPVPEGSTVRVTRGSVDSQVESAREAAREAVERADGDYAGAFVYDCACRQLILGEEFSTAVDALDEQLDAPFAGFETYGELCVEIGHGSGYHNTTTVVQLIPK